ncbi:MAG: hypothetical protein ACJ8KA_14110 [Sulfurifustis sp.]
MTKRRGLFIAAVAAALAVATAGAYPIDVLQVENTTSGRIVPLPMAAADVCAVTYHHSMYDQPVTEEFVIDRAGHIVLTALSSPSGAVREYFGVTEPGDYHRMHREMGEIVFRVAAGTPQRLRLRGADRSFMDFGDHGDRLVFRALHMPLAMYWFERLRGDS